MARLLSASELSVSWGLETSVKPQAQSRNTNCTLFGCRMRWCSMCLWKCMLTMFFCVTHCLCDSERAIEKQCQERCHSRFYPLRNCLSKSCIKRPTFANHRFTGKANKCIEWFTRILEIWHSSLVSWKFQVENKVGRMTRRQKRTLSAQYLCIWPCCASRLMWLININQSDFIFP